MDLSSFRAKYMHVSFDRITVLFLPKDSSFYTTGLLCERMDGSSSYPR